MAILVGICSLSFGPFLIEGISAFNFKSLRGILIGVFFGSFSSQLVHFLYGSTVKNGCKKLKKIFPWFSMALGKDSEIYFCLFVNGKIY